MNRPRTTSTLSVIRAGIPFLVALNLGQACTGTDARVTIAPMPILPGSETAVVLTNGSRVHRFTPPDFTPEEPGSFRWESEVVGLTAGVVSVEVTLDLADGTSVHGHYDFHAQDGWGHEVRLTVGTADPTQGCFGCGHAVRVEVPAVQRPATESAIWIWLTVDPRDENIVKVKRHLTSLCRPRAQSF